MPTRDGSPTRRQTKVARKPPQLSSVRESEWAEIVQEYLREVKELNSESARSHRFAMLVQALLGLEPGFIEAYVSGIEKYLKVKGKDRILKGEADNLFGNVVIEFEASLAKTRAEAEEQLRRYTAILWSHEPADARTPYLCLATDGARFIAYLSTTIRNAHGDN